jgi:ABC-type transporter Mla subunit MlaD
MRLRFTIRDLLWLSVGAALAVGWWLDHRKFRQFLAKSEVTVEAPPVGGLQVRFKVMKNAAEVFDNENSGR